MTLGTNFPEDDDLHKKRAARLEINEKRTGYESTKFVMRIFLTSEDDPIIGMCYGRDIPSINKALTLDEISEEYHSGTLSFNVYANGRTRTECIRVSDIIRISYTEYKPDEDCFD